MKSYSITLTKWLSLVVLVTSLIMVGLGIWMYNTTDSACLKFLQAPIVVIGVSLIIVAICGYLGAAYGITWLLWIYAALLFVALCLLFSFMVFSFVVTDGKAGKYVSGRGYKEYHLGDYSTWLQRYVNNRWDSIRPCVQTYRPCHAVYTMGVTSDGAYNPQLEIGCCKPPDVCGYAFVNKSWEIPTTPSSASPDCRRFVGDGVNACFSCDTCKAGFLRFVKDDWRTGAQIMLAVFVIILLAYSAGCCAMRQARTYRSGYQRRIDI